MLQEFQTKCVSDRDFSSFARSLKALFHPACLARVVSWFAFVVAIFMAHENGDKQRETKSRHVQGMLDETEPLRERKERKRETLFISPK